MKVKNCLYMVMVALIATMTFALTSCSSDDEEGGNSDIVGTWKSVSAETWELGEISDSEEWIQFNNDGTYVEVSDDDGYVEISRGTWSCSGDVISISVDNETITYQILKKENNTMTVTWQGIATVELVKVDDSEIEKYLANEQDHGTLYVNGVAWERSNLQSTHFSDSWSDDNEYCYAIYAYYARQGSALFNDNIHINAANYKSYGGIKEGTDLTETFDWEISYNENQYQYNNSSKPWISGYYRKKISGHAYVQSFVKHKSLTIRFDNLQLEYNNNSDADHHTGYDVSNPKTITLNGTVTFPYDD